MLGRYSETARVEECLALLNEIKNDYGKYGLLNIIGNSSALRGSIVLSVTDFGVHIVSSSGT